MENQEQQCQTSQYPQQKPISSGKSTILESHIPPLVQSMKWTTGENVLDYGCSFGNTGVEYILPSVRETGSTLYGVDISEAAIECAQNNYGHDGIHFKVGNIIGDDFPFNHVEFDKIFSLHVFHQIRLQDIQEALEGLWGILKPGGQLAFTFFTVSTWNDEPYKRLAKSDLWAPYLQNYLDYIPVWLQNKKDYATVFKGELEKAGFSVIKCEQLPQQYKLIPTDIAADFFIALNVLQDVPDELKDTLTKDVRKTITDMLGVPIKSKGVTLPFEYFLGIAKKE